MRTSRFIVPVLLSFYFTGSHAVAGEKPSLQELAAEANLLASPLVESESTVGLVVGLLVDGETAVQGFGRTSLEVETAPDGKTLFEIGSITKTFTAILLADAVQRGELELDDPLEDFLPTSVDPLQHDDRSITLFDLVTHTSGLPRMPNNFSPADAKNPYADYTWEALLEFLSNYKLRKTPGSRYAYSNLGMGLLGQILAQHAESDYATLVEERITEPLALHDTAIVLNEDQLGRLATGHNADFVAVPNWDLGALEGAGAIRSTAEDMLQYLQANLSEFEHSLQDAMQMTHSERREIASSGGEIAMAWHIQPGTGFLWHNGGTGGYRAFAAFHPEKHVGVVVLMNTMTYMLEPLGFELTKLVAGEPTKPIEIRTPIEMSVELLQDYVGQYQLSPLARFDITLDGSHLRAQLTAQPAVRIYPEAEDEFFYRMVDAQLSFVREENGQVTSLVLHQNGQDLPAKRLKPKE